MSSSKRVVSLVPDGGPPGAVPAGVKDQNDALLDRSGGERHSNNMDETKFGRLEGVVEALKVIKPMTMSVVSLVTAILIGGIAFLGVQVARLDQKIENNAQPVNDKLYALPQRLS